VCFHPLELRPKADDMNYTQARDKTMTVGRNDAVDREVSARTWLFWFYPPLFFAPELLIAFDSPILAMGIYAVLLVVLVIQRAFFTRSDAERNLYFGLLLLPLMRMTSLALPFTQLPVQYWHLTAATPLTLCALLLLRWFRHSRSSTRLGSNNLSFQLLIAFGGIALGIAATNVLQASPWANVNALLGLDSLLRWLPLSSALVITAVCEEIIYRALIQSQAVALFRGVGVIYSALLYAIMSVSSFTVPTLGSFQFAFVFLTALLFGCIVYWTGSIVGVSLAHALMNCTAMILLPLAQLQPDTDASTSVVIIGIVGAVIAAVPLFIVITHLDKKSKGNIAKS